MQIKQEQVSAHAATIYIHPATFNTQVSPSTHRTDIT